MKWIAILALFLAAGTALAQSNASRSPAAEAPWYVRSGRARLVGHFNNPQQMLRLAFSLAHPHQAEEQQLIHELMTPGSPQFHHFLTAAEWNARFAPSMADEQAVVDWATSQGMTITKRYPNRLLVDVEAPLATIEKALQVRINNYLLEGYTYFANDCDAVIPAHLSGIILSVGGLDNLPRMHPEHFSGKQPPRPAYTPGPVVGVGHTYRTNGDGTRRQKGRANVANITGSAYDPVDIYSSAAYNYDGLKNLGHCCNPDGLTTGSPPESSIAVATYGNLHWDSGTSTFPDLVGFTSQYGLAANVTAIPIAGGVVDCNVGPSNCDSDEETALDTEWSTATSNSFGSGLDTAQVYVYEDGGSAETMYNQMLTDGYARIFSTSWSCTEIYGCSSSEMDARDGYFSSMVAQGWTLMTASGDRGAADDCNFESPAHTSVSYPASDPNVIGVGGTALQTDSTFSSEVAWTGGTGSGSCSHNGGGSGGGCSVKYKTAYDSSLPTQPYADFQVGANGDCGDYRSVPDIALNAAVNQNMYFNGSLFGISGTSISSPMLAGFFAQEGAYLLYLKDVTSNKCGSAAQACGPMGNGNYYLYYFGLNPTYPAHYPFYDITSGCNSNDVTAADSLTYFCAGTGYDSVTGWGTANMLQLAWAINTYIAGDFEAPEVDFSGSPTTGTWYKTSQTVEWSITGTATNGAVPNGVAGFSSAWDSLPTDSSSKATPYTGTADSFYTGPQTPNTTTGSLILNSSNEGCHTAHVRAWDNAGATSDNTYGKVCFDDKPPVVNCGSPDGLWHATNVSIACTASDNLSGLAVPADSSFNLTTTVSSGTETNNAFTGTLAVYDVAGNDTVAGPIGGNKVDMKPPAVNCGSPDGLWHATDVSIACTASDGGSGLAVPADLSFNLTTSVPAGTETNNASTNSLKVYDNVGNLTTAGPIGGNKVDKKPPSITINQPTATAYLHSGTLTLNYTVTDGGSGVATVTPTMNGNTSVAGGGLTSGTVINLLTALPLGANRFKISAADKVGNNDSSSVTFTIVVTPQSIINDVNEFVASRGINRDVGAVLLGELNDALRERNGGQCRPADTMYSTFISTVQFMAEARSISPTDASILIADARYLISHCP
jgi:xanthomonalisin